MLTYSFSIFRTFSQMIIELLRNMHIQFIYCVIFYTFSNFLKKFNKMIDVMAKTKQQLKIKLSITIKN